jgi:hypothetical protein
MMTDSSLSVSSTATCTRVHAHVVCAASTVPLLTISVSWYREGAPAARSVVESLLLFPLRSGVTGKAALFYLCSPNHYV